jgi:hypothetical protein
MPSISMVTTLSIVLSFLVILKEVLVHLVKTSLHGRFSSQEFLILAGKLAAAWKLEDFLSDKLIPNTLLLQ